MFEVPQLKAEFFKALGHPVRIRALELLGEEPKTVSGLLELVDTSQPQLSRHLAQLRIAGLVVAHRAGATVVYSIADERITEVLRLSREMLLDMATATRDGLERS
jgi:ArsR family transcriptional regulator, arsenate/arsenite/antimonite-responsive transcriptional repressor